MDISVIIPAYNAINYIDKCITKLFEQDFKGKYEIIVVNDGSKDETLKKLNEYAKKNEIIKVINQKNAGQAVARNKAIDIATGKYIMFVDIDDFVDNTILTKMYNLAEKKNADLVYCDYYEYYNDNELKIVRNSFTSNEKKNGILANFAPWGKLYRREFFINSNLRFMEGKLFEDIAIVPVLAAISKKSVYLKEPLYYYNCANISSIRTKTYNKKLEDIFDSIDVTYKNFKEYDLLNKYFDEIEFIYLYSFLKGGVFRFADFKEGLDKINPLRKKILSMFPNMLNNKYYKMMNIKNKILILLSYYAKPYFIHLIKRIKK